MTLLPHLAARLFGTPLLIARPKLEVILAVLAPRLGLPTLDAAVRVPVPKDAEAASAPPGIAVIPIHGTLGLEAESGLMSYTHIAAQLDAALGDPQARGILLDVDSPGGESGGVFDLADRIRSAARVKPVWAVANDTAFSAAYALASAASKVFLSRTGGVGSIGVIAVHADQSGKDAQEGVRYTTVFAGARKNDFNPHAPLSDEAFASLEVEVNRVYDLFVTTVARPRGLTPDAVRATEAGLFFGQDAVEVGLADGLGTREDALAQLTATLAAGSPALPRLSLITEDPAMKQTPDTPAPTVEPTAEAAPVPEREAPVVTPPPGPPTTAAAGPAPLETQREAAFDIAQTCTLAGRPELIAGFLEAGLSPARVRQELLALQAEVSPEIASRIAPVTSPYPQRAADAADNPLLQTVKRRLAAH